MTTLRKISEISTAVTPATGDRLVILDDPAGTPATGYTTVDNFALAANNLSDLASAATARTNLGLKRVYVGAPSGTAATDRAAINTAITAAAGTKPIVFDPGATYTVDQQIQLRTGTAGVKIIGNHATIQAAAGTWNSGDAVLAHGTTTSTNVQIADLTIDANSLADHALRMTLCSSGTNVRNITASNANSHGVYLDRCQLATFQVVRSSSNGGDGLYIVDCNGANFYLCRGNSNTGNGFQVTRSTLSGGCILMGCDSESNGTQGIHINGTRSPMRVIGCWVEGNGTSGTTNHDGVLITNVTQGTWVAYCKISGTRVTDNVAVQITGTSEQVTVHHNHYADAGGGSALFADTSSDASGSNILIESNVTGSVGAHADKVSRAQKLSAEKLTNTTFEADVTSWTTSQCTSAQSAAQAHGGSNSLLMTSTGNNCRVYQAATLVEGAMYVYDAWFYAPSSAPVTTGVRLRFNAGDGTIITTSTSATQDAWTQLTGHFVALGATGEFGLQAVTDNTANPSGQVYWDDISLKRILVQEAVSLGTLDGDNMFRTNDPSSGLNF